jgi:hypothetical protein
VRAAVAGPDTVGPKIVADEVAPGPAQDTQAQRAQQLQDVGAKTPTVAQWGALLEEPTVDTTAQVFDETSEHVAVELAQAPTRIDGDSAHICLLLERYRHC